MVYNSVPCRTVVPGIDLNRRSIIDFLYVRLSFSTHTPLGHSFSPVDLITFFLLNISKYPTMVWFGEEGGKSF